MRTFLKGYCFEGAREESWVIYLKQTKWWIKAYWPVKEFRLLSKGEFVHQAKVEMNEFKFRSKLESEHLKWTRYFELGELGTKLEFQIEVKKSAISNLQIHWQPQTWYPQLFKIYSSLESENLWGCSPDDFPYTIGPFTPF